MRIVGIVVQFVIFGILIFASLLAAGVLSNRLPLTEPPGFVTRLATYLNTNVAETTEGTPFAELQLRRYEAPEGLLFDAVRRAVQALKWEVTVQDDQKHEMQAVVTTKLWKFQDDVTIQVRPGQPSGSVLWIRAASRVGKGDLGTNTRHVIDLVGAVNGIVPEQALTPQKAKTD